MYQKSPQPTGMTGKWRVLPVLSIAHDTIARVRVICYGLKKRKEGKKKHLLNVWKCGLRFLRK